MDLPEKYMYLHPFFFVFINTPINKSNPPLWLSITAKYQLLDKC